MKERRRSQDPTESAMWGRLARLVLMVLVTCLTLSDNYYALTTDMTLEEYEKHVHTLSSKAKTVIVSTR